MTTHNLHSSHCTALIVGLLLHGRGSFGLGLKQSAVDHEDCHSPYRFLTDNNYCWKKLFHLDNDIVLLLVRLTVLEHNLFGFRSNGRPKGSDDKFRNFINAVYDKTQLQRKLFICLFFNNILKRRRFFFIKSV